MEVGNGQVFVGHSQQDCGIDSIVTCQTHGAAFVGTAIQSILAGKLYLLGG